MLIQAHWQNCENVRQTDFIAQNEFPDSEDGAMAAMEWAADVFERRRSEMPDGWCPMVCTRGSEYFVLAAPK